MSSSRKRVHATYETSLYDIQNLADEKGRKYPQLAHLLPSDAQIYPVNLETRKVEIFNSLSVQYDHNAEIVYFKCPRYYDNIDLTNTVCIIQYINANGDPGLYWVPWYDVSHYDKDPDDPAIETPVVLIPWAIGGLATAASGIVTFNIRFYRLAEDGETFLYNLSTRPAVGEVLHGLELSEEDYQEFKLDSQVVNQIYSNLQMAMENATTYWVDV